MPLRVYEAKGLTHLRAISTVLCVIAFAARALAAVIAMAAGREAAQAFISVFFIAGFRGCLAWVLYCVLAGPRWCRHA